MFIFLYGEDNYSSLKKFHEIIERYKKSHKTGLNFKDYNCETSDFIEIEGSVQSVSMFDEKKLIILRNPFFNAETEEKVLKFVKKIKKTPEAFVFFEKNKVKKASALFKFFKKNSEMIQEFNYLSDQELKKYIISEFEKYNAKIDFTALTMLMNFVGNNLWQMNQEIQKLANYKTQKDKKETIILEQDIALLIEPKIKTDIFKTIDAIGQKNKKLALFLIHKHLKNGDSPFYLFTMINFQFRNLLIVKQLAEKYGSIYNFPKNTGIHPFVLKKTFFQSQQFTFIALQNIYKKIFDTDLKIKTGKTTPTLAIDLLITGL